MKKLYLFSLLLFLTLLAIVAIVRAAPKTLAPSPDTLVRGSRSTVYYYAADGFRYVFPNEKTYSSWFTDYSQIILLTDEELAAIPLKGNVTYRPGIRLVKFYTDPKVYAVNKNGALRWVETERLAEELYGKHWNKIIDDIPDALFTNYNFSGSIKNANDYVPQNISSEVTSINKNFGIPETQYAPKSNTKFEDWVSPPVPIPPIILPLGVPPTATTTTSTPPIAPPPTPQTPSTPPTTTTTTPTTSSAKVTLLSPNGGETWYKGNTYTFQWDPAISSTVSGAGWIINIYKSSGGSWVIPSLGILPLSLSSYGWTVPTNLSDGNDYLAVITLVNSGSSDQSDALFSILTTSTTTPSQTPSQQDSTPPIISNVTATSTTETSTTITWTTNEQAYSQVFWGSTAYENQTGLTNQLVTQHSAQLTYLSSGTTYHYKVKSRGLTGNEAESTDQIFTTSVPPLVPPSSNKVTVLSPNGGEILQEGNTYTIQWEPSLSSDTPEAGNLRWGISLIKISYGIWNNVQSPGSIPITQTSYSWTVGTNYPAGDDYKIRLSLNCYFSCSVNLSQILPGGTYDASDATFTLLGTASPPSNPPSITVISPNGGENWTEGSTHTIQWTSQNIPAGNNMGIRVMNGKFEQQIIRSLLSSTDTSYSWWVPKNIPYNYQYTIQVYHFDSMGIIVAKDDSDAPFTILPEGTVLGESYSELNPLGLLAEDLIENLKFNEMFYADQGLCLHWVPSNAVALKNFGTEWQKLVKSFYGIPQGYLFCESLR